jgi:hypothetical protein
MKLDKQLQICFETEEIAALAYLAKMGKTRIEANNERSSPDPQERKAISLADRILNAAKYLAEEK